MTAGNIYCWGNGSGGALADNSGTSAHDVDYPALARLGRWSQAFLVWARLINLIIKQAAGLEIEKARISTLGTYPHQVTPFDADNSRYTFYSDSRL